MKSKLFFIMLFLAMFSMAFGQSSKLETYRNDLRNTRQTIVAEVLELTGAEGTAFWPIFREYEVDQAKIGDLKVALLAQYAKKYMMLTDKEAEGMLKTNFDLEEKMHNLDKKYAKKFNKVIPAPKVVRLFQVINQVSMLVDLKIASALPYAESLETYLED